jgi:ATP-dependent protease Clp ATPase subunit
MENKNQKSVIIVLSIVIIILMATCMFFATDKINLKKDNKTETNLTEEKESKDNNSTVNASLDKNVVIIENGKIISNEIPQELAGKYVNTNSKDSYIELSNENIAVSEPTGSGTTNVFENDAVKVNIYYLKYNDYTKQQYIIIEFYVENDGYNNKRVYTYIGQKSSHDNKFEFKSVESTPMAGEGQNSYPYKQQ